MTYALYAAMGFEPLPEPRFDALLSVAKRDYELIGRGEGDDYTFGMMVEWLAFGARGLASRSFPDLTESALPRGKLGYPVDIERRVCQGAFAW